MCVILQCSKRRRGGKEAVGRRLVLVVAPWTSAVARTTAWHTGPAEPLGSGRIFACTTRRHLRRRRATLLAAVTQITRSNPRVC
jgi:hypothetical protein